MKDAVRYLDIPTRITKTAVYFGDEELPGCIEKGGVIVQPGGHRNINRVTVTFLCGEVIVEDPHEDDS